MKAKIILIALISLVLTAFLQSAAPADDDENPRDFIVKGVPGGVSTTVDAGGNTYEATAKEKIVQSGALETVSGGKYTLRKIQTRIEFYLNDDTHIFLKNDGGVENISEKSYVDIRGPKNKKAVLANAVYVYKNKKMYDEMTDKDALPSKKSFQAPLTGYVTQVSPLLIIKGDDGAEYQVCFDDDTIWSNNTAASKEELLPGNRMKVIFDKRLSIRYKNYPVKIIVDKSKNVF
jgi:hypothetical protein